MTFMIMTYEGEPKFDEKHRIVYNIVEMTDEEMKKKNLAVIMGSMNTFLEKLKMEKFIFMKDLKDTKIIIKRAERLFFNTYRQS